ncbi:MAG: hypothetical protein MAG715_00990 [Methanonatronarchaeales archaeon]|nr:hypothetical protein [Methanonatronarchaeales archaeon]
MKQAERDLETAYKNLGIGEREAAIFFGHQAAEKGMKSLEIRRRGEYSFTHDLVRLYVELEVPERFMSALEDLNPAYTAVRYPDTADLGMDEVKPRLDAVEELLRWIKRR